MSSEKPPLHKKKDKVAFSTATVIANPLAGGRSKRRSVVRILEELRTSIPSVEFAQTRGQEDAARRAHDAVARGCELLIAIGGDGTVNQIVNGLFEGKRTSGRDCVLGIIPGGTSCSLAKELGIPRGLRALTVIADGTVRTIDLILLKWTTPQGDRKQSLTVTVANFGFGGAVVRAGGRAMKSLGGFLSYGMGATLRLFDYKSRRMSVEVDGREIARSRILCTVVANTQCEGGGMRVAPQAQPDDGLLDAVIVEDLSVLSRLRYFPKVYTGKHIGLPIVKCARGRKMFVSSTEMLPFEYDGEWAECQACSIEVLPKALSVLVPTGTARPGD